MIVAKTIPLAALSRSISRPLTLRAISSAAATLQKIGNVDLLGRPDGDLDGVDSTHFKRDSAVATTTEGDVDYRLPHPIWTKEELENAAFEHHEPEGFVEKAANATVMTLRHAFDLFTGYSLGFQGEKCMLRRVMFLETIAGVPGMVGAMSRHLGSLRRFRADRGWIHTLLEEAENERMHLMIALRMRDPSIPIRAMVMLAQGAFFWWYTLMYAISPRFCHRFVGYLEEQAVHTYTNIVNKIDQGLLPGFTVKAPLSVRNYYRLPEEATVKDVFKAIRADENHHREVNHAFAEMKRSEINPFRPGF